MAADNQQPEGSPLKQKPGAMVQLFVLVILPITLLLLLLSFGSVYVHQSAMRVLVGERDQRAATTLASAFSEDLDHQSHIILEVIQELENGVVAEDAISARQLSLNEFAAKLAIFTAGGEYLTSNAPRQFWEDLENPQAGRMAATGPFALSGSLGSLAEGGHFVLGAGAVEGQELIVVVAFSLDGIAERHLGELSSDDQLQIFLYDSDLDLLYTNSSDPEAGIPLTILSEQLSTSSLSDSSEYERDGQKIVAAYSTVEPFGWKLVIEEPWEALLSPLLTYTELGPLILVPLVLLAVGTAWFAIRQLVAPLRALEAHSAAMTRGDYQAIREDVGGIAEINRLQKSLVYLAEKVEGAQQNLRSYVGAITMGQEEERMRLAHELHDDTIQSLIALNQRIQMAQMPSPPKPADHTLTELGQMTEQAIEDLRRLTRALRPLYLEDLGLPSALEMLAQESAKTAGIVVEFKQLGRQRRLDPEVELALYRITQEALNNSLQHAKANRVELALIFTKKQVEITVKDNGTGFEVPESPANLAPQSHFGLLGMFERAELINANLQVNSQPGQGTQMRLSVSTQNGKESR